MLDIRFERNIQVGLIDIQMLYLYMESQEVILDSLNEQQLLMLRLMKNPMPEDSFKQMRQLAVKLLAQQIDESIEDWENKNEITPDHYEELSKQHFRSSSRKS
jgi:hypothetical protein